MKTSLIVYFLFFFRFLFCAQMLEKEVEFIGPESYNSTNADCIFRTSNNEMISLFKHVKGNSFWWSSGYPILSKISENGTVVLAKELSIPLNVEVSSFLELSNGNFVLTSYYDADGVIIMMDNQLNVLWAKNYGDVGNNGFYYDRLVNTIETSDGNLLSIGTSGSMSNGQASLYLSKVDMNGNILWGKTFGLGGDEDGSDLVELNGYYYAYGYGNGYGYTVPWLLKVSESGNLIWAKVVKGDNGGGNCRSIEVTNNGGLLLVFEEEYLNSAGVSCGDICIAEVNESCVPLWSKKIVSPSYKKIAKSMLDENGDLFVSGYVLEGPLYGNSNLVLDREIPFLIKLNEVKELSWANIFDDSDKDVKMLLSNMFNNFSIADNKVYMQYTQDSVSSSSAHLTSNVNLKILNKSGEGNCSQSMSVSLELSNCNIYDVTNLVDVLSGGYSFVLSVDSDDATSEYLESISCIDATGIREKKEEVFTLYPNPTSGSQVVTFDREVNNVMVYNIIGEVVLSLVNKECNSLNVSSLSSGTYIMKAKFYEGNNIIQKFIVN